MTNKRSIYSILCILLLLVGLTGHISSAYGQSFDMYEKMARKFLEKVLEIDLSRYTIWFNNSLVLPNDLGFRPRTVDLLYRFKEVSRNSTDEAFSVSFTFINDKLAYCNFYINGPFSSKKVSTDILDKAKGIVNKYIAWFSAEYAVPMLQMATPIQTLGNYTKIEDNVKFTITCEPDVDTGEIGFVRIGWNHFENGITFQRKTLSLSFTHDTLIFVDTWNLYRVGSAALSISERDAVRIAKEAVKNYTYTAADYVGKTVVVGNFTVLGKLLYVDLDTDCRSDYYTLYPFWEVYLCLDTMYLGGVTGLRVQIWADTGEVIGIYSTGSLATPNSTPNASGINSDGKRVFDAPAIALPIILVIIALVVLAAAIKKR
ncbi:MAG: hypothetical protein QXX34_08520 [Candidatus Bathyarchaeia archaeon]